MIERSPSCVMSLVIPCYNEAASLPQLVARIEERFPVDGRCEVILVDNGSTDGTPELLARIGEQHRSIRTVRVAKNRGYGFGVLAGLAAARGAFLGWTHADLQADPADALTALAILEQSDGPQRIYLKGQRCGRPLADAVFTVGMSMFESALLTTPLWDINAQPNIFPRAFYEQVVDGAPHDFSLDLYFYHAARRQRLQVVRFPVRFGPRAFGTSHWNVNWSSKLRFIKRTMTFSLELRRRLTRQTRRDATTPRARR